MNFGSLPASLGRFLPNGYDIEDELKATMNIPVFHDDQHGTAIAALAAVLGALRPIKKGIGEAKGGYVWRRRSRQRLLQDCSWKMASNRKI